MKANELMIGDYVNVTGKEGLHSVDILELLPRIGKVIGLDEEIVYVDYINYAFSLGDVEPIPLTSEILYENLRELPEVIRWFWDDKKSTDDDKKSTDDEMWFIIHTNSLDHITLDANIRYVHELQHIMRLCGIEKEIIIKKED